jgi:hypothetical protein
MTQKEGNSAVALKSIVTVRPPPRKRPAKSRPEGEGTTE